MRPKVLWIVLGPLIALCLIVREATLARRLDYVTTEREGLAAEIEATRVRLDEAELKLRELRGQPESTISPVQESTLQQALARVTALETRLQNISRANGGGVSWRPTVPEYDPTKPPPTLEPTRTPANATPRRAWGPEQITGPPDTDRAGDFQSTWASREPDGGVEWLWADFERAVDLAEVRVRETFNPGAISKVTAMVNGQQVVLWEGTATGGSAPRDFTVPVNANVSAQSVVVHLDTSRVSGWNEIDAVELVGRDGSRQWATAVNASSSYADRNGNAEPAGVVDEQKFILTDPTSRER